MIRYNCADNDNHIKFDPEDGEFLFGDVAGCNWLVVGIDDMIKVFELAGYEWHPVVGRRA